MTSYIIKKKNGNVYIFTRKISYDPFRFNHGFGVYGITSVFEVDELFGDSIDKKVIIKNC